jgi:hypothetical protein
MSEEAPLNPGDLCHHGTNLLPTYSVIWVDGDKAWVRDVSTGQDAVVDVGRCVRLDATPPASDEEEIAPAGLNWPDGQPRP